MAILRKPPHKVLRRFTAPITYCLQRRALSETLYVDGYKKNRAMPGFLMMLRSAACGDDLTLFHDGSDFRLAVLALALSLLFGARLARRFSLGTLLLLAAARLAAITIFSPFSARRAPA